MSEFTLSPGFAREIERRSSRAALAAGATYLGEMAETLSNSPPRSGRAYEFRKGSLRPLGAAQHDFAAAVRKRRRMRVRRRRVRIHIASAPGEPPALLTGTLRRRRAQRLSSGQGGQVVVEFGSKTDYARRLEVGGDDKRGGSIAARPAWAATMVRAWPRMLADFHAELNRGA